MTLLTSFAVDFELVACDRSEDRDGATGLKWFRADRRFLNDLLGRVVGVVLAHVLMEDRDDPSPLADLMTIHEVSGLFALENSPA